MTASRNDFFAALSMGSGNVGYPIGSLIFEYRINQCPPVFRRAQILMCGLFLTPGELSENLMIR